MGTASFAATGSVQTWTCPAGVTSISVDGRGAKGGSADFAGAGGARLQVTVTVTPGNIYDLSVGVAGSLPGAGWPDGASGGSQGIGSGVGAGGGGDTWMAAHSASESAALWVAAGGGGGSSNSAGVANSTLDTETTSPTNAGAGSTGALGKRGGGGGGGGWRGGAGGSGGNGGGSGTSMARSGVTSSPTVTGGFQSGPGAVTLTWADPPATAEAARATVAVEAWPATAQPGPVASTTTRAVIGVAAHPATAQPGPVTATAARATVTLTARPATASATAVAVAARATTAMIARPATAVAGPTTAAAARATIVVTGRAALVDSPILSIYDIGRSHKPAVEGLLRWLPWRANDGTQLGVVQAGSHNAIAADYVFSPFDDWGRCSAKARRTHLIPATSPSAWGNDAAIDSVDKCATWLGTVRCRTDKVFLAAASMGALAVLNWARTHLDQVAAVALCVPAVDLADLHDRTALGYQAEIEAAYGGHAGYLAALPTHNPTAFAADLASIPIKIWYSTNDPIIDPAKVQGFAATVGADLIVNPDPGGHDVTAAPGAHIAAWFDAHTPT